MFQLKHKVIIWSLLLVLCWALSPISAMALKCDKFYEGDYCPGDGKSFCCLNCPPGNQCQKETVCDPVPNGNNEVNCNTNQCVLTCNPGYQACGSECKLKAGGENCSDWNPCNNTCNACVRGYELSGGQCIEAILKLGRTSVFGDTIKQGDNNSLIFVNNSSVTIGSSTTAHLYVSGNSTIAQDLFMVHNKSIRIDSATDTTLFIGNYGDGQAFSYGTTPTASLVVEGDVKANQLCIQDSCRSSWPTGGGGLDGSGTSSYIAKWSNNNALTTSSIYDNGTNVGIGKTNPAVTLDVSGAITASETTTANRFKATNLVSCSKLLLADSAGTITCGPDPYVHPTGWGSQPNPALTGSNVISQITVNGTGHVTGVSTRGLTASDIGALASTSLKQAGDAGDGAVKYTGTTANAGYFYGGGTTAPSDTTYTLNFDGKFRATQLCLGGSCRSSWPTGDGGGLSGSGTSSYIAKWSDNNALTTSSIYDNGTNVGIGKTNPAVTLDVSGAITASETTTANRFKATNLVSCSKLLLADSAGTITCGPDPYVHPTGWGSQPNPALTGSNVISQITVNGTGHVTGVSTRGLTASDIGALASTSLKQAGDAGDGAVKYTGTTANAGYFYGGGTTAPSDTTYTLNFDGKFRATELCIKGDCKDNWPTGTAHNPVTLANIGTTSNSSGASINTNQVLTLQPASATYGGVVTTGEQTFAGTKTFSSNIIGTISTATKAIALASNGDNCNAGEYPLGVDAAGNVEGCTTLNTYLTTYYYTKGSGTSNYIAKWSNGDTLTTSSIYESGTNVGIGTTNFTGDAKLHIDGGINLVGEKTIISMNGNGKFALYNNPGDYDFVIGAPFGAKEWLTVAPTALKTSGKIDFNGTLDVANKKRMEISDTNNNILFYNKNGGQFMKLYMDSDTPTLQLSDASNTKGKLAVKGPIEFGGSLMVDNKTRISISTDTTGITFFKQDGLTEFFKVKTVGSGIKMSIGDGGSNSELDVGTVDPLYTIGGKRYATYMSGMTGVKEETSGVLTLDKNSAGLFMAKLDFIQSPEGSDLWLFGRTTNIINNQEHFNEITCLLTPNFSGETWYEKDWVSKDIIIFARPDNNQRERVEVSYRLTAPRFDSNSWNNYSNSDNEGFNLDQLLK